MIYNFKCNVAYMWICVLLLYIHKKIVGPTKRHLFPLLLQSVSQQMSISYVHSHGRCNNKKNYQTYKKGWWYNTMNHNEKWLVEKRKTVLTSSDAIKMHRVIWWGKVNSNKAFIHPVIHRNKFWFDHYPS